MHVKGRLVCLEYPAQTATDNPDHAQIVGLKIIPCDHFVGIDIEQARELVRRWNAFEEGGSYAGLLAACEVGEITLRDIASRHTSHSFHNNRVHSDSYDAIDILKAARASAKALARPQDGPG